MPAPVYLDHNATTPVHPCVVEAVAAALRDLPGNPSSDYEEGQRAAAALRSGRAAVARLIGAREPEIVLCASGSEANVTALTVALRARRERPWVLTQVTEHDSVLGCCEALGSLGVPVVRLPVDGRGRVSPDDVERELSGRPPAVVSVMHSNNETGVLQPIRAIGSVTRRHNGLLHVDAAQSVGRVRIDVTELGADLLTVVGHKMHAPKGVAALYVRTGTPLLPLVPGGGQEAGRRAGTPNVPYACGLGVAADLASRFLDDRGTARSARLRDLLASLLQEALPARLTVTAPDVPRLPNTLHVRIAGASGREVLRRAPDVRASTGSACHTGSPTPSHVLTAMGWTPRAADEALRLSVGPSTDEAGVRRAAGALAAAVSDVLARG